MYIARMMGLVHVVRLLCGVDGAFRPFVAAPLLTQVGTALQSPCLLAFCRDGSGVAGGDGLGVVVFLYSLVCFWIMAEQCQDLNFSKECKNIPMF